MQWPHTTSWCAGSASWEAPRSIIWPAAASACSGSIVSRADHDRGSSHGETRIIRLAYFEHPSYVPLVRRAYELWRELEIEAARPLLHVTGIAEIGPPDGALVTGTLDAARLHDIPHEVLAASELTRRYPAFRLPPHFVGVVQPDGGFVEAEPSVRAMRALAQRHGAEIAIWRDGPRHRAGERSRARS